MYAAGEGHTDLMQMFLAAGRVGASLNDAVTGMRNEDGTRPDDYDANKAMEGYTALHFACKNLRLRATAMLLDNVAKLREEDAAAAREKAGNGADTSDSREL